MDAAQAQPRLVLALERLGRVFGGTAAPDDAVQCTCHWGSEEELALLRTPGVELDPDLLRRTWQAGDWGGAHDGVLRRILPQLGRALAGETAVPFPGWYDEVGRCLSRSTWQQWPSPQREAVHGFLCAWWEQVLGDPEPALPPHEVLALCTEASGALAPWLAAWEDRDDAVSARHLARAVEHWAYDLLCDELPWFTWAEDVRAEALRAELTAWLLHRAPPRLRRVRAPEALLHRVRLLGLTGPARWEDPHWPYAP